MGPWKGLERCVGWMATRGDPSVPSPQQTRCEVPEQGNLPFFRSGTKGFPLVPKGQPTDDSRSDQVMALSGSLSVASQLPLRARGRRFDGKTKCGLSSTREKGIKNRARGIHSQVTRCVVGRCGEDVRLCGGWAGLSHVAEIHGRGNGGRQKRTRRRRVGIHRRGRARGMEFG